MSAKILRVWEENQQQILKIEKLKQGVVVSKDDSVEKVFSHTFVHKKDEYLGGRYDYKCLIGNISLRGI